MGYHFWKIQQVSPWREENNPSRLIGIHAVVCSVPRSVRFVETNGSQLVRDMGSGVCYIAPAV